MKKVFTIWIILIGFIMNNSCDNNQLIYSNSIDLRNVILDTILCQDQLSKHISQIVYLANIDSCPIGKISIIQRFEGYIIIYDEIQKMLFVFDDAGNAVSQISSQGNGLFNEVRDFTVVKNKNKLSIVIIDNIRQEIIQFSLAGQIQQRIKYKNYPHRIGRLKNSVLLCYPPPNNRYNNGYIFSSINLENCKVNRFEKSDINIPQESGLPFCSIAQIEGGIIYYDSFNRYIYQIDETGSIYKKTKLIFGQSIEFTRSFNYIEYVSKLRLENVVTYVYMVGDSLYITALIKGQLRIFIVDRSTLKGGLIDPTCRESLTLFGLQDCNNQLPPFWPSFQSDAQTLTHYLEPYELSKRENSKKKNNNNGLFRLNGFTRFDNPIIFNLIFKN